MCWYCTRASDDIYYGYSCGTTVLVLCIGIPFSVGFGVGTTTVTVLCIGIEPRLQIKYTIVVAAVLVPLYWYYVLVFSLDFA